MNCRSVQLCSWGPLGRVSYMMYHIIPYYPATNSHILHQAVMIKLTLVWIQTWSAQLLWYQQHFHSYFESAAGEGNICSCMRSNLACSVTLLCLIVVFKCQCEMETGIKEPQLCYPDLLLLVQTYAVSERWVRCAVTEWPVGSLAHPEICPGSFRLLSGHLPWGISETLTQFTALAVKPFSFS